ncbi:MAG TPA: hypothetical protein VJ624_06805 [Thermodesulfobacteriota bacterium]|nr:hypothetical protein [Thermodesulfobacteriota bacterium]
MSNNLSAISFLAFAETSDKMSTITRIWIEGLIIGWVGFFAAMFRFGSGILYSLTTVFFCIGTYGLISDPYVGPAVIAEQGTAYIPSVYGSILLMLVPLIGGFYLRTRHNQEVEQIGLLTREEGRGDKIIKCLKRERGVEK